MAEAKLLGVSGFQQAVKGGVRPNLFQVNHEFPDAMATEEDVAFLCKSASLPASTIGTVELPFRGRVIKVPGDRTFESWTATFYNEDTWKLRGAYESWIGLTNAVNANSATSSISEASKDITILQLDKFKSTDSKPETIREYKLVGAFPVSVSQISVAFDNNDSYEEFDVEFAYQYFTSTKGLNPLEKVTVS
jgi:hypothetical protein